VENNSKTLAILKTELMGLGYGRCECCGGIAQLLAHHWWEDCEAKRLGIPYETKRICFTCNNFLNRWNLEVLDIDSPSLPSEERGNHILPSWTIQQSAIQIMRRGFVPKSRLKRHCIDFNVDWDTLERDTILGTLLNFTPRQKPSLDVEIEVTKWLLAEQKRNSI